MSDLVERLRFIVEFGIPDFTNAKLLDEAVDEIERLRADNDILSTGKADLRAMLDAAADEIERLRADNERLRQLVATLTDADPRHDLAAENKRLQAELNRWHLDAPAYANVILSEENDALIAENEMSDRMSLPIGSGNPARDIFDLLREWTPEMGAPEPLMLTAAYEIERLRNGYVDSEKTEARLMALWKQERARLERRIEALEKLPALMVNLLADHDLCDPLAGDYD